MEIFLFKKVWFLLKFFFSMKKRSPSRSSFEVVAAIRKKAANDCLRPSYMFLSLCAYAKPLMCFAKLDLRLAALLRWMMFFFASLSSIVCTLG